MAKKYKPKRMSKNAARVIRFLEQSVLGTAYQRNIQEHLGLSDSQYKRVRTHLKKKRIARKFGKGYGKGLMLNG